jgi:hypothetical protein
LEEACPGTRVSADRRRERPGTMEVPDGEFCPSWPPHKEDWLT